MYSRFTHNMEVGHRLHKTFPGSKCENIHGHSMQVDLTIHGFHNGNVLCDMRGKPLEFGNVKKMFRSYIDENYDHRLLLSREDPFAQPLFMMQEVTVFMTDAEATNADHPDAVMKAKIQNEQVFLPGLRLCDDDPTTENICSWIAEHFAKELKCDLELFIQETGTNGVGCHASYDEITRKVTVY